MIQKTQTSKIPGPREIISRCERIRAQWGRGKSRERQNLAVAKQQRLLRDLFGSELDCRQAV